MMWSRIEIQPESTYIWKIGLREIFLKKINKEWLIFVRDSQDLAKEIIYTEQKDGISDVEWLTYIGDNQNNIQVLPAFPNRPIVVKPKTTLKVLPKKTIMLFIQIPTWIQFYSNSNTKENLIFECSSQELSSTWFGEPDNGLLAYSMSLEISVAFEKPKNTAHNIVCPIRLSNSSESILDIQRLLLHGEFLNIYRNERNLWSNEVRIKFKGENEISDVQYVNEAPFSTKTLHPLAIPRSNKSHNVITKSFHFIKSLTN